MICSAMQQLLAYQSNEKMMNQSFDTRYNAYIGIRSDALEQTLLMMYINSRARSALINMFVPKRTKTKVTIA